MCCQTGFDEITDIGFKLRTLGKAIGQHDEGLDDLAALFVGFADHTGHTHGGMADQAIFDLARADTVACRTDQIVIAPDKTDIAIRVKFAHIAGQKPFADEFIAGGFGVAPIFQKHHRIGRPNGNPAHFPGRQDIPRHIDHRNIMPRHGAAHDAGFGGHDRLAGTDHHVAFGLAIELVDGDAKHATPPIKKFRTQCFTTACDGADIAFELCRHIIPGGAHHLERGWRQEGIAHAIFGNQAKGGLGTEFFKTVCHDRLAVMPGWQKHIQQPADPCPVGRGPHDIAVLRKEIMRHFDTGQMPQQHTMGMQRALWLAGGARCINDQGRFISTRLDRFEIVAGLGRKCLEIKTAFRRAINDIDIFKGRKQIADFSNFACPFPIGHQCLGGTVAKPVFKGLDPEKGKERHGNATHFIGGDMGHRGFGALRQQDADPIPAPDAVTAHDIGETVRQAFKLGKAVIASRTIAPAIHQRKTIRIVCPLVANIDTNVEMGGYVPDKIRTHRRVIRTNRQHVSSLYPPRLFDFLISRRFGRRHASRCIRKYEPFCHAPSGTARCHTERFNLNGKGSSAPDQAGR